MSETDVVECGFRRPDMQVGLKVFDRFAICRGIDGMNVSLGLGMRASSGNQQRNGGSPGDGIVEASQGGGGCHIDVVQVNSRGIRTIFGELPLLKRGDKFKIGAGVAAAQTASAQRKLMRGELNAEIGRASCRERG